MGDITDSVKVRADSAREAAQKVIESRNDSGQYVGLSAEVRVLVRRADTGEERWFGVWGEETIHWNVNDADPPEWLASE